MNGAIDEGFMSYRNVLIWLPKIREDLSLNNARRSRRAMYLDRNQIKRGFDCKRNDKTNAEEN